MGLYFKTTLSDKFCLFELDCFSIKFPSVTDTFAGSAYVRYRRVSLMFPVRVCLRGLPPPSFENIEKKKIKLPKEYKTLESNRCTVNRTNVDVTKNRFPDKNHS